MNIIKKEILANQHSNYDHIEDLILRNKIRFSVLVVEQGNKIIDNKEFIMKVKEILPYGLNTYVSSDTLINIKKIIVNKNLARYITFFGIFKLVEIDKEVSRFGNNLEPISLKW